MIVAIDGPAGSGKSSTAKAVAALLGFRHLDSGALYRALTWAALRRGIEPEQWDGLEAAALDALRVRSIPRGDGFAVEVNGRPVDAEIRSADVNAHVSRMAAVPAVREWLLGALRDAGGGGNLVADGRDIGTVVFPHADIKVFLTCAPEERARRRLRERGEGEQDDDVSRETERLHARDLADSGRAVAPLVQAPDAIVLDTTRLSFAEQVAAIVEHVRSKGALDRGGASP